nr:family 43 glycosylhydrolase [Cellulosimicrobium sp. TH-20]
MSRHRRRRAAATIVAGVLALGAGLPAAHATATADDEPPAATALTGLTTTDRGDGTYDVPLLRSDVPDISVTRVPAAENDEGRDLYYMISTTMHLAPGAPIMKSYDLVSWEIVGYVYDRLGVGDVSSLRNGKNGYGNGQWASSLRYRDGTFYVVFNTNDLGGRTSSARTTSSTARGSAPRSAGGSTTRRCSSTRPTGGRPTSSTARARRAPSG